MNRKRLDGKAALNTGATGGKNTEKIMNKLPLARSAEIIVQEAGEEGLIYDLQTHKAFNLNETAFVVYKSCDGGTTFEELKLKTEFTDELIFLALDQFKKDNLLEKNQQYNSPLEGLSRREAIKRVGLATITALPVVYSLVAPTAASAQSQSACSCVNPGDCLTKTACPSTVNCNASRQCAP